MLASKNILPHHDARLLPVAELASHIPCILHCRSCGPKTEIRPTPSLTRLALRLTLAPYCCCLRLLRVDSEATGSINAAQLKELFWRLLNREMTDQEVDAIMNSHQKISNREFVMWSGFPKGCCWVGGSGAELCTLKATPDKLSLRPTLQGGAAGGQ